MINVKYLVGSVCILGLVIFIMCTLDCRIFFVLNPVIFKYTKINVVNYYTKLLLVIILRIIFLGLLRLKLVEIYIY